VAGPRVVMRGLGFGGGERRPGPKGGQAVLELSSGGGGGFWARDRRLPATGGHTE